MEKKRKRNAQIRTYTLTDGINHRYPYNHLATSISPHSLPHPNHSEWQWRQLWRVILGFSSRPDESEPPRRSPRWINEIYIFSTASRLPPESLAARLDIWKHTHEYKSTFSVCTCLHNKVLKCMHVVCFVVFPPPPLYPNLPTALCLTTARVCLSTGSVRSAVPLSSFQRKGPNCCFNGSFLSASSQCKVSSEPHGKFTQGVMPWISDLRVFSWFVVHRQGRGYVTSFLKGLVTLWRVSILTVWLCVCMREHKHRHPLLSQALAGS